MKKNQDPNWIKNIPLYIVVEVGKSEKTVNEILMWRKGTTIKLEDSLLNILRVYVNDKYYAYGDVLRNDDGEMSIRLKKILIDKEGLQDV
ncbi:FliM/FliN family flagellar motor switch protein [Bacillus mexicanus]|uniref:FliM/FliN family flagellar motor switch protein n=1 Tax=Bacillus mexicanus TaxID=2834415 RepID=UPI003D2491A3